MFKSKTLFVLGAGSSVEVNFPLGTQLKGKIADVLNIRFRSGYELESGDFRVVEALRCVARQNGLQSINQFLSACWFIKDAMPLAISIDNFLETHEKNAEVQLCGKLAIALCILYAEENSLLNLNLTIGGAFQSSITIQFPKLGFPNFFESCMRELPKRPLERSSITFLLYHSTMIAPLSTIFSMRCKTTTGFCEKMHEA